MEIMFLSALILAKRRITIFVRSALLEALYQTIRIGPRRQVHVHAAALIGTVKRKAGNYRNAEKRLSNEFDDATGAVLGIEAGGGADASIAGFNGGRAAATCFAPVALPALFSTGLVAAWFAATAGRCGVLRGGGAATFGLAGAAAGVVVAVVSAVPKPILRAKLLKILFGVDGASSDDDGLVASASC
jgi:hypothetical protein